MSLVRIAILVTAALAIAAAAGAVSPVARADDDADVIHLTFDKSSAGEGIWQGTVSGDVRGRLKTVLLSATPGSAPGILDVTFDWIIKGRRAFTARLSGTLNTNTGAVAMSGRVTKGRYKGAWVEERGQLVDPATLRFQGTIDVFLEDDDDDEDD